MGLEGYFYLVVAIGVVAIAAFLFAVNWHREHGKPYREVDKLADAMQAFQEKFGLLPPNLDDEERFRRFLAKAFPTLKQPQLTVLPKKLDAAESLVFWLSRVGTDPQNPFPADAKDCYVFFEFPESRVRDGRFYPSAEGETDHYVYFHYEQFDVAEYNGFRP